MQRRNYLLGISSLFATVTAGCAGLAAPAADEDEPGNGSDPPGEADPYSIDATLSNETASTITVVLAIRDETGDTLRSGAETIGPGDAVRLPGVAQPGVERSVSVAVGETSVSETISFDVQSTSEQVDGSLNVIYGGPGDLAVRFVPATDEPEPQGPRLDGHAVVGIPGDPLGLASHQDRGGLVIPTTDALTDVLADLDHDRTREFVEATAFGNGEVLIYLATTARQTCYSLEIDRIEVAGEDVAIDAAAARTAPREDPCGDAITPLAAFVRLSFEPDGGMPGAVRAHFAGDTPPDGSLVLDM